MSKQRMIPEITAKFRSILIFGPPGAGKGTISKVLSCTGSQYHLSSGDILRGLSPESPTGQLFYSYSSQGLLAPDDVMIDIWHYYVTGLIATNRFIPEHQLLLLDGIPRTTDQAKLIAEYIDVEHIIVLDIKDPEELVTRLLRRAQIEGRKDDSQAEIIRTRLDVYQKNTAKVLEYYPPEKISIFNASQHPFAVVRDIITELDALLCGKPFLSR